MKPRMFIASSVDTLDLAYAAQEGLDYDAEITVWSQGAFHLSRSAMSSLLDVVDSSDFGLFIFAPSDVTHIKETDKLTVRDNVIFELGMFIGRLGPERCFIVTPSGVDDLHLPTDLLGITTASYDPTRQDKNLVAALGPACNRVRKSIRALGRISPVAAVPADLQVATSQTPDAPVLLTDENDIIATIQSWMGSRPSEENSRVMHYSRVDQSLHLTPGSARKYLELAARRWDYVPERKGAETIIFKSSRYY